MIGISIRESLLWAVSMLFVPRKSMFIILRYWAKMEYSTSKGKLYFTRFQDCCYMTDCPWFSSRGQKKQSLLLL